MKNIQIEVKEKKKKEFFCRFETENFNRLNFLLYHLLYDYEEELFDFIILLQ